MRTANSEQRTANGEPRTPNPEHRIPNAEYRTPNSERQTSNTERWCLLPFHVGDTAHHMALTDLLVRTVAQKGPAVWWHATNVTTLLVGPSMRKLEANGAQGGIPVVARPTGGGAVLVGPGVLGLDIALPANHSLLRGDVVEDYRWLGLVWETALRGLQVKASTIGIDLARAMSEQVASVRDSELSCFASFSPYEVASSGRKVVGLSQVRRAGGVLFSSAIHIDSYPAELASLLPISVERRRRLAAHLERYAAGLGQVAEFPVTPGDVMSAVRQSLRTQHGISLTNSRWANSDLSQSWAAASNRFELT
jgi:lipoate---protein ligase